MRTLMQEWRAYQAPRGWEADSEVERMIDVYTKDAGGPVAYFRQPEQAPCDRHDEHPHTFDGIRLYIARRHRGLSRKDLAERACKVHLLGMPYSCVYPGQRDAILTATDLRAMERERKEPGLALGGAIAFALGVKLSDLIECHARMVRERNGWRFWDDVAPARG